MYHANPSSLMLPALASSAGSSSLSPTAGQSWLILPHCVPRKPVTEIGTASGSRNLRLASRGCRPLMRSWVLGSTEKQKAGTGEVPASLSL
jgi:hypothetical protein